ncbi:hypothetical protein [Gemmiger sp.]|uniref:hypothetical protein n=2 Tax=Gemmiger sp. TaxID=2049027 RepID=UPI002A918EB4|nr:hypothetical protein [Gemmiger sp.]
MEKSINHIRYAKKAKPLMQINYCKGAICMKEVKVVAKRVISNKDKSSDEQRLLATFKKVKRMECPCCGETMYLNENVWRCQNCAYCISQERMPNGEIFWFCDGYERFMNVQPGFTTRTGKWICISCGWINDVTENDIDK